MSRQPPDRQVAPAVQRLRLRYAKRDRLRFASHRDFQRAFERALRESETRYRASLEALLDAFGVFRPVPGPEGRPVDFEELWETAMAQRDYQPQDHHA